MAKDDAILTQDQIGDMESTAMNGFGHNDHAVRERVYREDIMALIGHINATTRPDPSEGELREILLRAIHPGLTSVEGMSLEKADGLINVEAALAALRIAAKK